MPLQVECESSHCSESSLAPTHSACLIFVVSKINVPIILIPQRKFGFLLMYFFFSGVLSFIEAIEQSDVSLGILYHQYPSPGYKLISLSLSFHIWKLWVCEFKFIFTRQLIVFKSWWKILKFSSLFYLKVGAAPPSFPPIPAGIPLCGAQAGYPISFLCPINHMSLTNQWSVAPSLPRVGSLVDPSVEQCAFHKCFLLMKQSTLFYWIMFYYWRKLLSNLFVNEHH